MVKILSQNRMITVTLVLVVIAIAFRVDPARGLLTGDAA